jgi:RNA polymerase sigma factor (sigma-70 family)
MVNKDTSDSDLVNACRNGVRAAWELLVRRYERLIYTVPRRAGLDEHAAADVFQIVCTKLLENIDKLKQPDRIHAWLVTTARHETLQILASNRKKSVSTSTQEDDEDAALEVRDESPLPDELLVTLESEHRVHLALSKLDERSRDFITELFLRDEPLPYDALAAKFGISVGSIGPTRARCLAKLRAQLT